MAVRFSFQPENPETLRRALSSLWPTKKWNWDLLKVEGKFQIFIEEELFFEEPLFSVMEFLWQAKQWRSDGMKGDMEYNSIETEDNPLILFRKAEEDGWQLVSPWQSFVSSQLHRTDELTAAINELEEGFKR